LHFRLKLVQISSVRNKRAGALLFIDLDNFKTLNDTRGHDNGDMLLQQVAERLATCVRQEDTVARLGGDEFVVMLTELSENLEDAAIQAKKICGKILEALNPPYGIAGIDHYSTCSIGVTLFNDRQGTR
jgi:diguanylate cyclase (GGDEF)-like protein